MKNTENTSSILDNIRKKMQRIDGAEVTENIELGDEFDYIDKASKQADTKQVADDIITNSKKNVLEEIKNTPSSTEEDSVNVDDIISDAKANQEATAASYTTNLPTQNMDDPLQAQNVNDLKTNNEAIPQATGLSSTKNNLDDLDDLDLEEKGDDADDLDLSDLDDLEENNEDDDAENNIDDLDLDDLDVDADKHQDAKENVVAEKNPPSDSAKKIDDLNLENDTSIDELDLGTDLNPEPTNPEIQPIQASNEITTNQFQEMPSTSEKADLNILDNNNLTSGNMISNKVAEEAGKSIKKLMEQTAPKKTETYVDNSPAFKSGETIESMVMSLLQPKLEQWLNENLSSIVERIVSSEIKKIVPKE